MASLQILALVAIAIGTYLLYSRLTTGSNTLPLPPGPKPLPLLGNIADFPPAGVPEFEHWLKHKDVYGGISSVTVMGMTMVIIHDKKMAHDLLEQHASKTSGRPTMVMANKLCGYEKIVVCQDYNPTFKRCRKLLHRELGTKNSAAQFLDVQDREVKRQLVRALNEPDKWLDHFKTTAGATVLKMAYDYTVEPHRPDFLVTLIDRMMMEFSLAASPMSWAVDILPILQHLPEGFPGAGFKQTARKWRRSIEATAYIPYHFVLRQMDAQTNSPSFVSKLIQQCKSETDGDREQIGREDSEAIAWTAASLYGAAADTTVITLTIFTLAMLQNPEIQQHAQAEIDRVIGDRLPTFADRDNLPYITALVKESSRWWPISPMGFPHTVTEAFDYNGYHIPKDAMLLPAVKWFLHDPSVYADPEKFDPARFLSPRNEPDPVDAFGYGRRICSGRFFADQSLFLNIVNSLACFNIRPSGDSPVDVKPKPGILSYPTEFDFKIEVRSEKHRDLIRAAGKEVPFEPSDAAHLESVDNFEAKA